MAESPVAAPEPDVLLATKLHMPAPRPGQVPRPRLTARLDEGLARGLVLVCAPAGYGKTVLLADWAQRKPGERALSAAAYGFLAVAEWLRGRLTEAERAFASSVTKWHETGQLTMTAWGWYELVLLRRAQGRLDAALLTCQQALDSLVTSGRPLPAAGPSYVARAEIAYQRDDLDLALRHAT